MSKRLIHFHLKSWQSVTSSSKANVSVEYFILMLKVLVFEMRVPLLGFSQCKSNETFSNKMNYSVLAKPWCIYSIKILHGRVLLSEPP